MIDAINVEIFRKDDKNIVNIFLIEIKIVIKISTNNPKLNPDSNNRSPQIIKFYPIN